MTESSSRSATISRATTETDIECTLAIDGTGESTVDSGVSFFDHMLQSFATHGLFDLTLKCEGDTDVDAHHSIEDIGIVLGKALDDCLGDRSDIVRFADRKIPLDEAVATVVLDVSGRPGFHFDGSFSEATVGGFPSDLARHFFESVAMNGKLTVHLSVSGKNTHHEVEALFKAFARALDEATRIDSRRSGTPSTKGTL